MRDSFPIDLVVTYVDDCDAVWQNTISQYNTEYLSARYRSWDVFKYWFRGVEQHMPFIRTVHLVVSNIEQVPEWLDQSKAHVVLHEDIIPKELLPTFNSTTIEMYLHRIPGLAEHFVYSNDDMMPMNGMAISSFFAEAGQPIYDIVNKTYAHTIFWQQCRNSCKLAARLAHTNAGKGYFCPKHSMSPMLKSVFEEVHSHAGPEIFKSCTKFREPWNFTQYLFPDYALLTEKAVEGHWSFQYFRLDECQELFQNLAKNAHAVVCLNDVDVEDFDERKHNLVNALDDIFPRKCRYEK